MATDTWLSGSGLWSDGALWSEGTPPAAGDTAVLTAGSIGTSTLALTVGQWIQSGGTLSGGNTLTVTGLAQFSGTYEVETGSGKTLLKGVTEIDNYGLGLDGGRILENAGTLLLQGGTIYLGENLLGTTFGGGTIVNDKGASFLIESDGTTVQVDTGNTGFTNAGLVEKEFSSGTSNIYALFTNTGTVSVQSGTLSFDGGGTSSGGAFTVAAGATLGFGGGNFTLTGGTYTVAGQTLVSGGTLTLSGGAITTAEFAQSGGTIAGSDTLTVTGPALFSGSYEVGTGTGKTLLKGATEIDNLGLGLDGGWTLENAGTLSLQSGTIYLGENLLGTTFGGGTIVNDKGASFLIESDGTTVQVDTGNTGFTNAGLVAKEFTSGTSNLYARFTNTGTVSVQSGTLSLDGGGTSSGAGFTVAAGATLGFGGGNFTLTGGTYTVAGQTLVSGGALTLSGGAVTTAEFAQSYGTIAGSDTLTVTGPALFSGSYDAETGTGKTLLKGATQIDDTYLTVDGGWTLENAGTLILQSGTIYLGYDPFATTEGGGTIVNDKGASFLIESDGTTVQVDTGNTGFTNAGLVAKEFTSGTSNIYALFTNTGTVSVQSGTLSLDGGGTSSGAGFTVAAGATLGFGGGNFTLTGGTYTVAGQTLLSGGTLTLAGGAMTVGEFAQSYGTIAGGNILTVTGPALFSGSYDAETGTGKTLLKGATKVNDTYLTLDGGRTLENAGTLILQSGTIYLGYDPLATSQGGGTIVNDKGASFLIESDGTTVQVDTGNTGFTNAGLVAKEFTSGTSTIYSPFTNTGTVSVQSGTLSFDGGGSSSGAGFTVAAGATLGFGGGNFTLTAGTYTVAGQTLVSGGTLTLSGGAVTTGEFAQSYGTIAGGNILTVTGAALFSGSYDAETGTGKTLLKGATKVNDTYLTLDGGRTLENAGTLILQSGTIYLGYDPLATSQGGGTIVNDKGASFLIESDGTAVQVYLGNTAFTNAGLVEKEFTSGTSTIYSPFTNTGTVSVQSGTLSLDGGGSSIGAGFTVAAGATLGFGGGNFTLTGGTYTVAGRTLISGGTANFASATIGSFGNSLEITGGALALGAQAPTVGVFSQSYGTVTGSNTLTVTGPALFSGSYDAETGTGKTLLKGATQVDDTYLTLDGGRTLENAGALILQSGTIYLGYDPFATTQGGGTIVNDKGASFLIESDGTAVQVYLGNTAFTNAGLVEKVAGIGTSNIYAAFTDTVTASVSPGGASTTGTVSVQSGTLSFDGGGSSSGAAFTVAAGATLAFGGGKFTFTGGTYNVVGHTVVAGGDLDIDSAVATGKAISIDSGILEFAVNSPTAITFAGTSGELLLDHSKTFTGTISGLRSSAPSDVVDLKDINFATATRSYSGTTTSGILTVTDGADTAKLSMIGDYTTSSFNLQNDGTGHVQFYDPVPTTTKNIAIKGVGSTATKLADIALFGDHAAPTVAASADVVSGDLHRSIASLLGSESSLAASHRL